MVGAQQAIRLGAVIDREVVAERIAARAAPLPSREADRSDTEQPEATAPAGGHATTAHLVETVDLGAVEAARAGTGLGVAPFVARAVIDAARAWPALNAGQTEVHLGTGTGTVAGADGLRLRALATALADPAPGTPTIAVVDAGATGARTALAPLPASGTAVVTVGRVEMRPASRPGIDGEWSLAVRPVSDLALTFDSRSVPAADATGFLAEVRTTLEGRAWEAER